MIDAKKRALASLIGQAGRIARRWRDQRVTSDAELDELVRRAEIFDAHVPSTTKEVS